MMDCPRCGHAEVTGAECPACGVIVAKARAPRGRPAPQAPAEADSPSRRPGPATLALVVVGVAAGLWAWRRTPPPDPVTGPGVATTATPVSGTEERRPPLTVAPPRVASTPPPAPAEPAPVLDDAAATTAADQETANRLAELLDNGIPTGPEDLRSAEDLYARYGAVARALLEAVLIDTANQERRVRNHDEAIRLLERAASLAPDSPHPRRNLVGAWTEAGDWPEAEAAARAFLAMSPGDVEVLQALAYALVRQDRQVEAAEVLEDLLEISDDPAARALLARIEGGLESEAGLTEHRLAHFNVRYDGGEHVEVGREVLRVLDRHYATLVRALDHEPVAPIPVILLSRESYAEVTGAPGWSGGLYDSFDGKVRIPIAGLTPSLTSEMDDTLLHELTHAFVADRSRGVAPRVLQEGFAQYMEGKRVEEILDRRELEALAEGRVAGVGGFYMSALSFVQWLIAQRGRGGINDLLDSMADTGSPDAAFEDVYGKDSKGLMRDWRTFMIRRHGG